MDGQGGLRKKKFSTACNALARQRNEGWPALESSMVLTFTSILLAGCMDRYTPNAITTDAHYLVIDGFANVGGDSLSVNLSRTIPISSTIHAPAELKSVINLEDDERTSIPLHERGDGRYSRTNLGLNMGRKYRPHITTSGGSQYLSDYVPFSVTWAITGEGLQIRVSAHNPTKGNGYYKIFLCRNVAI
jgi:hypothetical protein